MEQWTKEDLEHHLRLIIPVVFKQRLKFTQPDNLKTRDEKKYGTFCALESISEDMRNALAGVFRGATYQGDENTQILMAIHDVVKKWKQYGSFNGGKKHTKQEEGYLEAIEWVFDHKFPQLAKVLNIK